MELTVHLAPGVRTLASLGFADAAAVFAAPRRPVRDGFAGDDVTGVRVDSVRCAHPAGGTLLVRRFREPHFAEWSRARFTPPRSLSLAEREWNLFCHLRAHGIGTPEPLAVGRGRGAVFARESFLVLRELEHVRPLSDWVRSRDLSDVARARLARAVGETLARVLRCGVELAHVDGDALQAAGPRETVRGAEPCVLQQIAERQGLAPVSPFDDKLAWSELPEVAVVDVRGGRIRRDLGARERERTLASLVHSLGALDERFVAQVARHALAT